MLVTFQIRADTLDKLSAANVVYAKGEPVLETDTGRLRFGDGIHPFLERPSLSFDPAQMEALTNAAIAAAAAAQAAATEAAASAGGSLAATTDRLGVVELATLDETLTGTAGKVVTADGLQARITAIPGPPAASTSVAGVVPLATSSEAQAGTVTGKAVTPAGLAAVLASFTGGGSGPATPVVAVASQAAMLALTATKGQVAVRSDTGQTFMLSNNTPSTLSSWVDLPAIGGVITVAGRKGAVALTQNDVADTSTRVAMTPAERTYVAGLPTALGDIAAQSSATTTASMTTALTDDGLILQSQFLNALGANDTATRALFATILGFVAKPTTGQINYTVPYTAGTAASVVRPNGTDTLYTRVNWLATDGTLTVPTAAIPNHDYVDHTGV